MSNREVRFINYQKQFQKIGDDIMSIVRETLEAGDVMMRSQLTDFESNIASFVGTPRAVGVNSCTDGLFLSLKGLGVGPDDEVITVSHTFIATVASIHHTGAKPILVDIAEDGAMDPVAFEKAITPKTKVVIPVHVNGYLCEMDKICQIAEANNITVLEDSAQALGAHFQGRYGGSWGIAGTFSFYPAKQLGAYGDGGAVTTQSEELAEKLMLLRNHGRTPEGDIDCYSFNSRLDNLHAAILDYKLKLLPQWVEERRRFAQMYYDGLRELSQLKLPTPPSKEADRYCSFQNFEFQAERRDELLSFLRGRGVEIILPWGGKAVHHFPKLGLGHFDAQLPETNSRFSSIMTVPLHNELEDGDIEYVISCVRDFYSNA